MLDSEKAADYSRRLAVQRARHLVPLTRRQAMTLCVTIHHRED